jgi:hypothetical protein
MIQLLFARLPLFKEEIKSAGVKKVLIFLILNKKKKIINTLNSVNNER